MLVGACARRSRPQWTEHLTKRRLAVLGILMPLAIMAAGISLPLGPLAEYFKLQALPLAYFPWFVGILLAYCAMTTVMKRYYIRRFGWA